MKNSKVLLSVIMVMVLIVVSVAPTFAVIAPENSAPGVVQVSKINSVLAEKMATATDEELLPVWVWFTDPDLSNVESMVQKQTGLTKDNIAVDTNVSTTEVSRALDMASMNDTESAKANAANQLQAYLEATKESRAIEKERTEKYLSAKRKITRDIYVDNNKEIISNFNIESTKIQFQSQLTPCMFAVLTKEEIIELTKDNTVVVIGYLDITELDEPMTNREVDNMQIDAIRNNYNFTGDGVNVLIYELGYVRDDCPTFNLWILDRNKIKVVYNESDNYTPSDHAIMADTATGDHAVNTAAVLQNCAIDTNIYSVAGNRWRDIEWAIENRNINIINASTNLGAPSVYTNSFASMWFDCLVNKYDVSLIASGGNYTDYGTQILAPASSYNSIAVGTYTASADLAEDKMKNYKYGPTTSTVLPCYKPDVVIASPDTSSASPVLSGIVAMIMEAKPYLKGNPEIIKAIIMASCHRKVKPTDGDSQENMTSGLTQKQGAGAVDAYRALKIAIKGTYGQSTISSGETTAFRFSLPESDNVNVSIAWFRDNTYTLKEVATGKNIQDIYEITVPELQELKLNIYRGGELISSSDKTNTAKQMVYLTNIIPDTRYRVAVKKVSNSSKTIVFGYAWSNKNYDLANMTIQGSRFVNKTLTTDLQYIDGKALTGYEEYTWERSADGTNWQSINGANSDTYTLTQYDSNKFIRCRVTLPDNTLSGATTVIAQLNEKVLRYGDVDNDGVVSAMDASLIDLYVVGTETLTEQQILVADVDGDGYVSTMDSTLIQQYANGLIDQFPVE